MKLLVLSDPFAFCGYYFQRLTPKLKTEVSIKQVLWEAVSCSFG